MGANAVSAEDLRGFSPRLGVPRVAPVGKEGRTSDQEKILAGAPDYNIFKTMAHHPELSARWGELAGYLLNGSTLPPRDREIVILRMGWLCQAPYEWSQHARIAKAVVNMTDAEVHRVAEGAAAKGWPDFEQMLLRMVDEVHYDAQISENTWQALRARYSLEQTIDVLYTAVQYQLVSMVLNSLGVQLDPSLQDRMPTDATPPRVAVIPTAKRLTSPRVRPLVVDALTPEQRELVIPQLRDGTLPNFDGTLINHTKFYRPWWRFGSYLQDDSHLPPKTRELLILRTAWLIKTEYEWAHHVPIAKEAGLTDAEIARIKQGVRAKGWSEDQAALLQAADELRQEAFISDATWKALAQRYSLKQMFEIIFTVGGYTMTGTAINSFGVQLEPGYRGFGSGAIQN
jgi:alkylhydroperoxidase family enzyme